MSVNFTPSMGSIKDMKPFKFWCQKVLPTVYDDSLSYYELLCKVVQYLNDNVDNINLLNDNVTNLYNAYVALQEYVNNYFDQNFPELVSDKLNEMAEDGTLTELIKAYIDPYFEEKSDEIDEAISAQNAEISEAIENQNASIDLLDTQMTQFIADHAGLVTETILWEASTNETLTFIDDEITLSDDATNYEYIDLHWSLGNGTEIVRMLASDFTNGVINISRGKARNGVGDGGTTTIAIPTIDLQITNSRIVKIVAGTSVKYWTGTLNTGVTNQVPDDNPNWYVGSIRKIVGVKNTQNDQEVINARIGADGTVYATLGEAIRTQVNELNNVIRDTTGNYVIPITGYGQYIVTNDTTADINNPVSDSRYNYSVVSAEKGDKFTINTTGATGPRAWAFIASDGTVLLKSEINAICNGIVLTAPTNSAYLIVNRKEDNRLSYVGELLSYKINSYDNKVDYIESLIDLAYAKTPTYILTTGELSNSANWVTYWFRIESVQEVTKIATKCATTVTINQIAFFSGEPSTQTFIRGIRFKVADSINTVENIEIPTTTKFILICTRIEGIDSVIIDGVNGLKIGDTVQKAFNKFQNKIMLIGYSFVNNEYNYVINTAEMYNYVGSHNYDAIKGDIRITLDNALVMCHDAGFTFDGNGKIITYDSTNNTPIRNLTLEQITALEFAQTTSTGGVMKVPTFEKYLAICRKYGKPCFITLRDEYIDTILPIVFEAIKKYKLENNVIINSLTYETLQKVRNVNVTIPVVYTVNNRSTNITLADITDAAKLGNSAYGFYATNSGTPQELETRISANSTYLDVIKTLGLPIYVAILRKTQLDIIVMNNFDGVQSVDLWE